MMKLNPDERIAKYEDSGSISARVMLGIISVLLIFGAGVSYWYFVMRLPTFEDVYKRLGIAPLPWSVASHASVQKRLSDLDREPCYREAVLGLSKELFDSGYPRESAVSALAFAKQCGDLKNESLLERAYVGFKEVSDFQAMLKVAKDLVEIDPANPTYRYSRGTTYERLSNFSKALADYIAALQLMGNPSKVAASQFYEISRMYAELGRFCDAIAPIETFISFNPAENRNPQLTKIIAEYASKGNCATKYAQGFARVAFLDATRGYILSVVINGVAGNFVLDTGATYVAVTPEFSSRAKINVDAADEMPVKTVGGTASANIGYAKTMSVGAAEAEGVVVAVIRGAVDPFGSRLDGLLGMSFLSRFKVVLARESIELTAIPLR